MSTSWFLPPLDPRQQITFVRTGPAVELRMNGNVVLSAMDTEAAKELARWLVEVATVPPSSRLLSYVCWKLGASDDGFTATLLEAMRRADGANAARLAHEFPREWAAMQAWEASPTGEFDLPDDPPSPPKGEGDNQR